MKKIFTALVTLMIIFQFSTINGQATYYAIKTGNWTDPTLWSLTFGGPVANAVPGALDQANTGGFTVTVNQPGLQCKDLLVDINSPGFAVRFLAPSVFLTINGSLVGVDNSIPGFTFASPPISNLFFGLGWLIFTGNNIGDLNIGIFNEVIAYWNSLTPIFRVSFALTTNTGIIDFIYNGLTFAADNLVVTNSILLLSGTINAPASFALGITTASLSITGGTLTTASYVNSSSISISSGGILSTSYFGPDQQEGWWYQTNRPNTFNLSGKIEYNSGNDQNIYVVPYGSLTLSGGGSKTIIGTGALDINGDLELGSSVIFVDNGQPISVGGDYTNNNNWIPGVNMSFDGSSDQVLSGNDTLSYNGGVYIANSGGAVVSLGNQNMILNSFLDVSSGAIFNPGDRDVATIANIIANGTIQAGNGTSTFNFDGTTNITGSGASFNHVIINATKTLNGPTGNFSVSGNFVKNGSFNSNNGTITFNGLSDQSITESGVLNLYNVNIDNSNSATVNIDGDVDLLGALSMSSSVARIDADGAGLGVLTLKSSAINQDAQISNIPSPSNFLGNVSVERYVDGVTDVNNNWRYLSVPLTNANVSMWQDDFPVTGNFSNPSPGTPDPTGPSIYYFDGAAAPYWYTVGTGASTSATPLENGRGYSAYTYQTSDFTVSTRGTIAKGDISKDLTPNVWALMGNPYPSTIGWNNMDITGLYGAVYIRRVNGSYATYVQGDPEGLNHPNDSWLGEISLGQSFWIFSETTSSIGFTEANKTSSPNYEFLREGEPGNLIKIMLSSDIQDDEILIQFAGDVEDGFESQRDALKYRNGDYHSDLGRYSYINLSSYIVNPAEDMAINSISFLDDCNKTVYLKIQDVIEGPHKLSFINFEAFQLGYDIKLKDNFANETITIDGNNEYNFQITTDPASFADGRFEVEFSAELVDRAYDYYTNSMCDQSYATVTVENAVAGATYEIYKGAEMIGDPILAESNEVTMQVPKNILEIGETIFNMNTDIGSCEAYIENAFIVDYDSIYEITNVEDGIGCGDEMVILSANGAPLDGYYHWYENEMDDQPIPNETQSEFVISELDTTTTYYVSAVNALGCESALRKAVKGIVGEIPNGTPTADTPSSSCANSSVTLVASGVSENGFYVWYDGNENIIKDENESSYVTPPLNDSSVFYVAFGNQFNCAGEKAMIEVPVIKLPKPTISEENGVLTSSYSSNNQWFKDDVKIDGATGTTYDTQLEEGSYAVEYSDNSCTVMSDPVNIEGVTGLDDIEESDLIKLFPNPASDNLYVEYNVPSENKIRLLIYTTGGRLVDSAYMDRYNNGHKTAINITGYAQGMYITVVYDGENYVYSKFRKQ